MRRVGGGRNRSLAHDPASAHNSAGGYLVKAVTSKTKTETETNWTRGKKTQVARSKVAQSLVAGGLLVGVSLSMVACSAESGETNAISPSGSPTSTDVSSSAATAKSGDYGDAIGSGEKVDTPTGAYETISLNPNADIYKYNNGDGNPAAIEAAGWTEEDGTAGQKLITDYLVREFLDSSALETGDEGFRQWYETQAAGYYSPSVYEQLGQMGGSSNAVVGNFAGVRGVPNLIHDGSPRVKRLSLKLDAVTPYESSDTGVRAINYAVQYSADYRVDDASAATFAGGTMGQTGEQFLDGMLAKPQLRDGTGENVYRAYGTVYAVVGKDVKNQWKIIGFESSTDYDASDFTRPIPE